MKFFYDGQIRRYVGQIIRMLSGFKYETDDGKQITVPVLYGDMTRQVANVIKENSENKLPSAPRIAVYITGIQLDRTRISDASFVSKVNIRERKFDEETQTYTREQGNNYTVERLMPTPYKLTLKADIWSTNTNQKLQIMEQIMMLFNPSIEIQTTDNYVDWTSLTVVDLVDTTFSSRSIPVGTDSDIDVGTMTFETPIWISPPSKVKRLGVIQSVIMNVFDESQTFTADARTTVSGFDIFVYYNKDSEQFYAELLDPKQAVNYLIKMNNQWPSDNSNVNWAAIIGMFVGKYRAGSSQIFLTQNTDYEVVGTFAISEIDPTKLIINFDQDTYPTNTVLVGPIATKGTVDAIVDPQNFGPNAANYTYDKLPASAAGTRYLIINDIGDAGNEDGPDAWKNADGSDFVARVNDIIEWDGERWHILMDAANVNELVYITNIRTGIQYKFEEGEWTRSFEGEYPRGQWRIVL